MIALGDTHPHLVAIARKLGHPPSASELRLIERVMYQLYRWTEAEWGQAQWVDPVEIAKHVKDGRFWAGGTSMSAITNNLGVFKHTAPPWWRDNPLIRMYCDVLQRMPRLDGEYVDGVDGLAYWSEELRTGNNADVYRAFALGAVGEDKIPAKEWLKKQEKGE